jgi:hypothetical protein
MGAVVGAAEYTPDQIDTPRPPLPTLQLRKPDRQNMVFMVLLFSIKWLFQWNVAERELTGLVCSRVADTARGELDETSNVFAHLNAAARHRQPS